MQLESVGNLSEQEEQLDFVESIKVDQDYLDRVEAVRDGKAITLETVLQSFTYNPSKDDFTVEVQSTEFLRKWLHVACKRMKEPTSRLVQLYRRFK